MTVRTAIGPYPLSAYLAAVGLLRVIGEQRDREVTGSWTSDSFVLDGIEPDELVTFLLEDFAPSPVFSPWNKEGDPTQNKTTSEQLGHLVDSADARFRTYRDTVDAWRSIAGSAAWADGDKHERLLAWRSTAPDPALGWIDAAAAAGPDRAWFPPLLGSGGNDGRFEFARLLHGELIRLFLDDRQTRHTEGWLRSLLFGDPGPALVDSTSGMYDGDAAGGPNSSPQGSAPSASNPWAIVLAFEGLIAFGSAVASRLGVGRRQLVGAPFTVRASNADGTAAPGEDARGEFLAPLWSRPARWSELRRLIGEGRLSWHGGMATDSVDAIRAVASLGADRGIDSFARHQIAKRNGLSYVAAPAGRVLVGDVTGIGGLGSADAWVKGARSVQTASVQAAARRYDRAQIAVVEADGRPESYQDALIALADLERAVSSSGAGRERCDPFPLQTRGAPTLDAATWMPILDDGTPELRLAASVASLQDHDHLPGARHPVVRLALRGLGGTPRWPRWAEDSDQRDPLAIEAWQAREGVLLAVLRRRLLEAPEVPVRPGPDTTEGRLDLRPVGYGSGLWARLDDVAAVLRGSVDVDRTMVIARGLALLDGWDGPDVRRSLSTSTPQHVPEPWFAAVRLCTSADLLRIRTDNTDSDPVQVPARRRWARDISTGSLDHVGEDAATILRRLGVTHLRHLAAPAIDDRRAIALALLVRIAPFDSARLAEALGASLTSTSVHGKEQQ